MSKLTVKAIEKLINQESRFDFQLKGFITKVENGNLHIYKEICELGFKDSYEVMEYVRKKLYPRFDVINDEWLVTGRIKRLNLTITRVPMQIWRRECELGDPHWPSVMVLNHISEYKGQGYPPVTIDYLEYIDAADGYASLLYLPENDKFIFNL